MSLRIKIETAQLAMQIMSEALMGLHPRHNTNVGNEWRYISTNRGFNQASADLVKFAARLAASYDELDEGDVRAITQFYGSFPDSVLPEFLAALTLRHGYFIDAAGDDLTYTWKYLLQLAEAQA